MGQLINLDPSANLIKEAPILNSAPLHALTQLKAVQGLSVPFYNRVYYKELENSIQIVYKFFKNQYIPVSITKKTNQAYLDEEGVVAISGDDRLFGYKIKYRYKNYDKIKSVLFKKRIYGKPSFTIPLLAQLKLLSVLQVGPYVGTMINGTDCFLYDNFLQHYTEILFSVKQNATKIKAKLQKHQFQGNFSKIVNFSYSPIHHDIVIKPQYADQPKQKSNCMPPSSLFIQNNSDQLKLSVLEDRLLKQLQIIDEKTNMLSSIENFMFQKNIDKCKTIFEESLKKLPNKKQKEKHYLKFIQLLTDNFYYHECIQQFVQQIERQKSEISKQGEIEDEENIFKKLELRAKNIKFKSVNFNSENQVDQFSQSCSIFSQQIKMSKLRFNIQQNNNVRVNQLILQINKEAGKNNIGYDYAIMLMKQGKSRLALACFERLLRTEQIQLIMQAQINNLMGMIYYERNYFKLSCKYFEASLSKIIKLRLYSNKMIQLYNNIGCSLFREGKHTEAIQVFSIALEYRIGSNDMNIVLRNNRALAFLKAGKLKQCKQEFIAILNSGEPINHAETICKVYCNLGYMNLKSKQYLKARDDFKFAIQIQQKCLIPKGYNASPFLHNNMAMARFKLKQFRQSLQHFTKYSAEFEKLKSLEGVIINFNIALAYKQCYKNQLATLHIEKCKGLIAGLPQSIKQLYEKRIIAEAEAINRSNIEEVSQESSGAIIQGMPSSISRKG